MTYCMSDFKNALSDFRFLKNRGYPHKAALKITGDHYRLTKLERNCLFRGVVEQHSCELTAKKLIRSKENVSLSLGIDWFNVVITIESYLKGNPVFLSDDGLTRDSSDVHGSYRITPVSERAIDEIVLALENIKPPQVDIFIDSPVSHSKDIAHLLRLRLDSNRSFSFSIEVVQSADFPLKSYPGIVASSDTIIINHTEKVFDLVGFVLKKAYDFEPPTLDMLKLS
jgi:hypothetical protein